MPKSRSKRVRRQPPPKPKPKRSDPWVGALFFTFLLTGVTVILMGYLRADSPSWSLWYGLGLISASFGVATRWH